MTSAVCLLMTTVDLIEVERWLNQSPWNTQTKQDLSRFFYFYSIFSFYFLILPIFCVFDQEKGNIGLILTMTIKLIAS